MSLSNLILKCDLVLTIDNTTAHLSSSLGKETWILLPYSADFRWFENTTKACGTKATLFRQGSDNKWGNIIENILLKLKSKENNMNELNHIPLEEMLMMSFKAFDEGDSILGENTIKPLNKQKIRLLN